MIFDILKSGFNSFLATIGLKKNTTNLNCITNFDLSHFCGMWYEIARYDHWFEKDQIFVRSIYKVDQQTNEINVNNSGYIIETQNNVDTKDIQGIAKFKYPENTNIGWLKVSFFKPFYSDYKILYVDSTWTYMIVTGKTYDYFWILSKKQREEIAVPQFEKLISIAESFGFKKTKMIFK